MDQIKISKIGEKRALEILQRKPEEVKIISAVEKINNVSGRDPETVVTFASKV